MNDAEYQRVVASALTSAIRAYENAASILAELAAQRETLRTMELEIEAIGHAIESLETMQRIHDHAHTPRLEMN